MLRLERWASGLEIVLGLAIAVLAARAVSIGSAARIAAATPLDIEPIPALDSAADEVPDAGPILAAFASDEGDGGAAAHPEGLRLWGVAMVDDVGVAVLQTNGDGPQQLYWSGDSIGDATLVEIDWEHVTLDVDGERVTIPLEVEGTSPTPHPARDEPVARPTPEIRQTGRDSYIVDRGHLVDGVANMSSLLTQLRAVPEVQDGEPIGFRVFSIREGSIFRDLGLHDGDVVRRVNGATLRDPTALLSFLQGLGEEPRVALDLVRGGEAHTLVYDLR